jgi:hypothetical protein
MLLAVLVALTAFLAFTTLASATVTQPAGPYDPNGFAASCAQSPGGVPTEDVTESGAVLVSYCSFPDGSENSCNWITGICTYSYVPEPSGEVGRLPVEGGLLDDAPATRPGFGVAAPSIGGVLDRTP